MTFFHVNVAAAADWKALVEFTVKEFGRIDILVNNAGTSYVNKVSFRNPQVPKYSTRSGARIVFVLMTGRCVQPTLTVTEDEFDRVFDVNVKSIYLSVQAVVPQFLAQKSPCSIINIASTGATRPRPRLVWYNATKGAVWNATKGLAAEFGPENIRVNAVCPLLGATGLFSTFTGMEDTPENREKWLYNVPMGKLCEAVDVANATLFFASDESKFVTGTSLEVDGGKCV